VVHNAPPQPNAEILSQALIDELNAPSTPAAYIFHPAHTCNFSNVSEPKGVPRVIGAADLALMGVLEQLPPGHWQVFALHDVQGYEHMEIPALWGVPVGNS
jgi:DNA-directed RNA polymerase specialized sigma24 family protein